MKAKIGSIKTEVTMLTLILVLILFLPGAFLPMALKTLFTSNELIEMGVSMEDLQTMPTTQKKPASASRDGSSCLVTGLSA